VVALAKAGQKACVRAEGVNRACLSGTISLPCCLFTAIVRSSPSSLYATKYLVLSIAKKVLQQGRFYASNKVAVEDKKGGDNVKAMWPSLARLQAFGFLGIDISLPASYRLIRYGIALDHLEVKNVEQEFALLFNDH
jgi:hypothetical protein